MNDYRNSHHEPNTDIEKLEKNYIIVVNESSDKIIDVQNDKKYFEIYEFPLDFQEHLVDRRNTNLISKNRNQWNYWILVKQMSPIEL